MLSGQKTTSPVSLAVPHYVTLSRPDDYSAAAGRIFGATAVADKGGSLTSTDASLELAGVLVAEDPAQSIATLLIDGKETALTAGDTLPDGEKLERVGPTSVTLTRGSDEREIALQIAGDPMASFDAMYLARGGPIEDSHTARVNLPTISIGSMKTASVASRLAELRSQALQAMMRKARVAAPPSTTKQKPGRP